MRTVTIVLPQRRTPEDLKAFLAAVGGRWIDEVAAGHGVVAKDNGAIYVTLTSDVVNSPDVYTADELAEFRKLLGGVDPVSLVSIEIGHHGSSESLARAVATRLATEWSGAQDWRDAD